MNPMKITFLIGNGFDLGVGLKTRYSDFVPYYLSLPDNDPDIIAFKSIIESDKETWADAELALGKLTSSYDFKNALIFRNCYLNFSDSLGRYLQSEERRIDFQSNKKSILNVFSDSITNFKSHLTPEQRNDLSKVYKTHQSERIDYQFLDFNYTKIFDECISLLKRQRTAQFTRRFNNTEIVDSLDAVNHIHGTYDRTMIMGVNDESQIANKSIIKEPRLSKLLIKPTANQESRKGYIDSCIKKIKESQIICIYGMSFGKTDAFWWKTILTWLFATELRRLIIFVYRPNYNERNIKDLVDTTEDILQLFSQYGLTRNQLESIRSRIYIVINAPLFNTRLT